MSYCLTYEDPYEKLCKKYKHKKIKFREGRLYFDQVDDNAARAECKKFLNEDTGFGKRTKRKAIGLVKYVNIERL